VRWNRTQWNIPFILFINVGKSQFVFFWVAGNARVGRLSACRRYKKQEVEYERNEKMGLFPPQINQEHLLARIH